MSFTNKQQMTKISHSLITKPGDVVYSHYHFMPNILINDEAVIISANR